MCYDNTLFCKFLKYNISIENFYNRKDRKVDAFIFPEDKYLFKVISKNIGLMRSMLYSVFSNFKKKDT